MLDINFSCPDFYFGYNAYETLFLLKRNYPYIFNDYVTIGSIFGIFPSMIWNGGSVSIRGIATLENVKNTISFYNDQWNIPLRFTLTNSLLEEKHLYDTYCNKVLELANNGKNEITVSSPLLEDYLRTNFKNYKFIKSIVTTSDKPFDLDDKYIYTVVARRENKNFELLKTVPEDKRKKLEFLCNNPCPSNCKRIYTHYDIYNEVQLYKYGESEKSAIACSEITENFKRYDLRKRPEFISYEDIVNEYLPLGFNNFKLSPRHNKNIIIENLSEWLVKPEYQTDFRIILHEAYN